MTAGVIGRVVPELERFLNRHILGVQPQADNWPRPRSTPRVAIPTGIDHTDDTGTAWVLARRHSTAWHHRRTALGAWGYRFTHNRDIDCGWRLVDAATRFVRDNVAGDFDLVTLMPPAPIHRSQAVLPWMAKRLADNLNAKYDPEIFEPICPYAAHPDIAQHLAVRPPGVFGLNPKTDTSRDGQSVLLVDWMWHHGRTLRALTKLLVRKGATVTRFCWFD